MPGPNLPSYVGEVVDVLERLAGRLSVRHRGRIISAHETPPSLIFLRNGLGRSASVPVLPSGPYSLGERWAAALEPLDSRAEEQKEQGTFTDRSATAGKPKATSSRKPTFVQRERWKTIQKARPKGDVLVSNSAGIGN